MWGNPSLLIDGKPIMWEKWANKGLYRIANLYEQGIFKSFAQLSQQFGLERQEFWKFLQIRHCILSLPQAAACKPPAKSEIVTFLELIGHFPHLVSNFYQLLMKWTWPQKMGRRAYWQEMIGGELTDQEWEELLREMSRPTRDAHLKLMQYKIVNNLYWTPSRMYTLKLRQTPTCWRCQEETGDIAHMIFSCNKLNRFWNEIIANINSITGCTFSKDPWFCILHKKPQEPTIPGKTFKLGVAAVATAKKIILRHWKRDSLPTVQEWQTAMGELATFENTISKVNNSVQTHNETWKQFLEWLAGRQDRKTP
ncbi:uncharacterized protein LOC135355063 [Latimeria chalumnae]|uniref:uncharacterized protein LOC135355063 n=1 Tax=Latimeria chalumnae TaxID=7897 RepID=UPI00313F36EC